MEAGEEEGDAEERGEGVRDPTPGFFGDKGSDFQMRYLAMEDS